MKLLRKSLQARSVCWPCGLNILRWFISCVKCFPPSLTPGLKTTAIVTYLKALSIEKSVNSQQGLKTAIMLIKMLIGEAQQDRSIQTKNTYFLHCCSTIPMPLSLVASDRPTYTVQFLTYMFVRRCFLSITTVQFWICVMWTYSIKTMKCPWLFVLRLQKQCIVFKERSIQFGNKKIT
jgi:hypothetical protein